MDLEDEEWVNIRYDGLLEVHNDGDDEKIFSRNYVKSPSNFFKSNYFNTKHNLQNLVKDDEPIIEKQMVSCTSQLDHKDEVKLPSLINESKERSDDDHLKLDQDPIFQVVFKKENKFVEMKLDSHQESNLSHIETQSFQYEENSGDHIVDCSSPSKMIKQEIVAWEESNNKLNFWKWGLSGIGAFCSVGMAAATICIIIFGNGRKHKQQKLTIQIYPENKRIKQVVQKANEAMSAVRGVPLVKAQITYGGQYESL
uniref:uncharacterized protein LOC122608583 n=1 Tax=Erigeron canadensis TaxID=72917 RepID=UPI001CB9CC63|nr:uncharacterized protein LOC122608583 [Erigeron canadensis]